jgi:hypothetical protein
MTAIRGSKRPVPTDAALAPAQKVNAQLNCNIHNRFDIEVVDAETGKIKQRAQAENVICSQLWTRLLAPNTYFNYIFYGTGSGTPSLSDTALFTHLGYKAVAAPAYDYDWDEGWVSIRQRCQLSETENVGSTLTEVGIGYGTASTNLVTHAMLKDMNGNTISIAKTATDIINIYATVFVHWAADGYDSGTIRIIQPATWNFPTMPVFIRFLLGVSTSGLALYPTFSPGGHWPYIGSVDYADSSSYLSGSYVGGALTKSYNISEKTITLTVTRLAVAQGNVAGGIGAISFACYYSNSGTNYFSLPCFVFKVGGSWYAGTSITGEAIGAGDGSTVDFATAFDRVQSGAKIYVDGVEQTSGITVDANTPFLYGDMGRYFEAIERTPTDYIFPTPIAEWSYNKPAAGTYAIYYNPFYSYGIKSFSKTNYVTCEVSNDLGTWIDITAQYASVDSAYRTYKYWRLTSTSASGEAYISGMIADAITSANNIHFATAPASGAVITADYTTKTIAKDINHVFDLTVTIQLGEPTA